MKIENLIWDTNFFGYQVCKVELENFDAVQFEALIEDLSAIATKLVYVYPLDQVSINTLSSYKIPLADTKVTFEKRDAFVTKNNQHTASYDSDGQYEVIENLALLSGQFSRFKKDRNFSNNEFIKLYTEWIKRSVSKEIASGVIVYRDTGSIKGFISYKIIPTQDITIGLIAVDPSMHGKGIGKILMQSVENIACQNDIKKIIVSTQLDNKQAMNFYHSCGYTITEQREIYHLWIQ